MSRLPADIRGHLDGLETVDLKELAARADRQWANGHGAIALVAVVDLGGGATLGEELADTVAAVGQGARNSWQKKKFNKKFAQSNGSGSRGVGRGHAGASSSGGNSGGPSKKNDWAKLLQVSICQRHLKFGEDAFACSDPSSCQWGRMGN